MTWFGWNQTSNLKTLVCSWLCGFQRVNWKVRKGYTVLKKDTRPSADIRETSSILVLAIFGWNFCHYCKCAAPKSTQPRTMSLTPPASGTEETNGTKCWIFPGCGLGLTGCIRSQLDSSPYLPFFHPHSNLTVHTLTFCNLQSKKYEFYIISVHFISFISNA